MIVLALGKKNITVISLIMVALIRFLAAIVVYLILILTLLSSIGER